MLESKEELYRYTIRKTSRAIARYLSLHLKKYDITPEQWSVLKANNRGFNCIRILINYS